MEVRRRSVPEWFLSVNNLGNVRVPPKHGSCVRCRDAGCGVRLLLLESRQPSDTRCRTCLLTDGGTFGCVFCRIWTAGEGRGESGKVEEGKVGVVDSCERRSCWMKVEEEDRMT
ncbi:hypothetical protein E2C01_077077 [Portunus trituberculatus]|uniref:Uncharacterized protein n=1 Tax=Portunus trituberculatus TaxID=210409 RepID=A0A5B7IDE1_PORTR|nr:hypothetical protein [Portunus trituberculatus]